MRLGLFTAFVIALLLPAGTGAQSIGDLGSISGEPFTLSVDPQYPAPYSQAVISSIHGSVDLTNATMSASVGGKEIYKGSVRPLSVKLGKAGSITNIRITISSGGTNYSKTVSVQPQDVVLIAEPISSAPPLYQGKPLVPLGGSVRIVAMANLRNAAGAASSPTRYSYAWTVDGTHISNSSGVGKSTIIVASPLQYRSRSVSVAVTSPDGALVGGASISLSAEQSLVRIYENDPLLGIRYDRAVSGNYSIAGAEATLYAAPFYMSTTSGLPSVQWFLNGDPAQIGNLITLRPAGRGEGSASLSLVASTKQSATAAMNLSLIFGAKQDTNFFGL